MQANRFIRRTGNNAYDVHIDGQVRGRIAFDGGYYMPTFGPNLYGEDEALSQCLTLESAARCIAGAAKANDDYMEAEMESEMRAEFVMSWVCGGGAAEDASTAYALFGDRS